MSKRNRFVRYRHMLDHVQEAVELVQDKHRADLDRDRVLSLALVRLLEIIGEAANYIPKEEQARYPEIPWPQIVGLRNRLIHGYDSVDYDILWQIITQDLPPLIVTLQQIIPTDDQS
jgi:uncharacterized protein with HEPN domain